jgi:hypothetical protein
MLVDPQMEIRMKAIFTLLLVLTVSGCAPLETPHKVNELSPGDVPLHLIVSNQSFDIDPVDIDVYVDEVHAISGDFEVGSQHTFLTFDFTTGAGPHALRAVGHGREVALGESFELTGETWGVLMFWYYARSEDGHEADAEHFSWSAQPTRPMFD